MLCSKFVRGVLLPKRLPIGRWISVGAAQESEPITMLTYPGSRVLQLSRPESGNVVTENILNTIKSKLDLYEGLPTVTCVFFTSQSTEFFSSGLETRLLDEKNRRKQLITVANQVSDTLVRSTKETIAICGGDVDSSVFGVLANSKFRLGTETTRFQMRDLLEGRLPLGGAIAHHLGKTSDKGYALARYLGVSGRVLSAYDLYTLGLVTHIVQQDSPEDALAIALAHGSSNEDSIKAVQAPCINTEGVQQLLDTMHIFMGVVDMPGSENEQGPTRKVKFRSPDRIRREMTEYYENNRRGKNTHKKFFLTKQMKLSIEAEIVVEARRREDFEKRSKLVEKPGDFHLLTHPVWDRVLLVPTQETPLEKYFDSDEARERVEDLDDVLEEILQCFSGEDVAECRRRVEEAARSGQGVTLHGEDGWSQEHWAVRALACWNSIEPSLVSDWFALAKKSAEAASLADAYKLEEEAA